MMISKFWSENLKRRRDCLEDMEDNIKTNLGEIGWVDTA
jgi:hypothetical protein